MSVDDYIYIYIYIWMNVCGSHSVRGWAAKEGILSLSSLKQWWSVQKTFLCLYWHKDHTKSYAHENLRDWKRRAKVDSQLGVRLRGSQLGVRLQSSQLGVRFRSRGSDIQSSRRGARQSRTKTQSRKAMSRRFSIFGCWVKFSLSTCDSHT